MPPPAEGIATRFILGPALRTQPDRRLVTLVREGYESAFEEIVRRYGKALTRYAAAIVGGRSEDVTQDAFSKALLALRRDDADIELRPWLFRIVRNTALNDLRDSPPSPEVLAEAIAGGRNPAEELERREELIELIERLQALPEPQRAAIVMRELEGLSHEEIAAALGLTGGGARQAIYRARQALRDGIGMLIPLPLLQAMLSGPGPSAAEAAVGAAGIGSAAGAGVALKATAATVLVAGAVGAGVALNDNPHKGDASAAPVRIERGSSDATVSAPTPAEGSSGEGRDGNGRGEGEAGDDHGGHGREAGDDHGGHDENEPGDDRGGHGGVSGGRHESEPGDDHGGQSGPSRNERSGSGTGDDGHSGSRSGSSGDGGSGPSGLRVDDSGHGGGGGPGPSGDAGGAGEPLEPSNDLLSEDHSGSGSSGSGSGSGSDSGDESEPPADDGNSGPG